MLALVILVSINIFFRNFFKKLFFNTSFSEGNSLSSLEIQSTKEIEWLEKSNFLTLKKKIGDNFFYTLAAYRFEELKEIENEISKNESVTNYQLNK